VSGQLRYIETIAKYQPSTDLASCRLPETDGQVDELRMRGQLTDDRRRRLPRLPPYWRPVIDGGSSMTSL